MTQPNVTPTVRAEAARRGVNLAGVRGTGAGGRISLADVRAAAPDSGARTAGGPRAAMSSTTAHPALSCVSHFDPRVTVAIDVYGRNPLLDDLRQVSPSAYAAAMREAPAPTLFASGDLPPFTASGVDPAMLLRLPWFLRHEAAAAKDPGAVLALIEETVSDPDGHLWTSESEGGSDYRVRLQVWARGPGLPTYGT